MAYSTAKLVTTVEKPIPSAIHPTLLSGRRLVIIQPTTTKTTPDAVKTRGVARFPKEPPGTVVWVELGNGQHQEKGEGAEEHPSELGPFLTATPARSAEQQDHGG